MGGVLVFGVNGRLGGGRVEAGVGHLEGVECAIVSLAGEGMDVSINEVGFAFLERQKEANWCVV